jgi:cation transport ATPase
MSGKHKNHGWKALQLKIDGMHCANCEVLVERRFIKIAGVRKVKVSHITGRAEVTGYGDLDLRLFQRAIEDDRLFGRALGYAKQKAIQAQPHAELQSRYVEISAIFLVLVWLYVILGQLDLLPQNFALPNDIGYGLAFLVGVVASMSTCIAVNPMMAAAAMASSSLTVVGNSLRIRRQELS